MRQLRNQLILSATDLSNFLSCRHRTGLEMAEAQRKRKRPHWDDPLLDILFARGLEHEKAYVQSLENAGLALADLSGVDGRDQQLAYTLDAMRAGHHVIVQGALAADGWFGTRRLAKIDFVARDAANRDLGRRGEAFVVEFERRRLHDVEQRPDLAKRVEWTSEERGDGAGYDISSFAADGSPRLIEVKTTGLGKYFPFNVTANEVRCSEAQHGQFPPLSRVPVQ